MIKTKTTTEENWKLIPDFSSYEISDHGNVYNIRFQRLMRVSYTQFGHAKISLISDIDNKRYDRSVARLVAEAFVESPDPLCDQVIILNGNYFNVAAENLAWRPKWFAWRYTRQLKIEQPIYYRNLPVINVVTGTRYNSIIETGMAEGLLFDDIWRSTYMASPLFPYGHIFEIFR